METKELEKLIKKLGEIDIQRWEYQYEREYSRNFLSVYIDNLKFSMAKLSSAYELYIESAEEEITNLCFINYVFDNKKKTQKEMLGKFYEQTLTSLKEHKQKIIKERLDEFLKD